MRRLSFRAVTSLSTASPAASTLQRVGASLLFKAAHVPLDGWTILFTRHPPMATWLVSGMSVCSFLCDTRFRFAGRPLAVESLDHVAILFDL